MITETRILEASDRKQIDEIAATRDDVMGAPATEDYILAFHEVMDAYLDPKTEDRIVVGAFSGQTLVCYLGMFFWKALPYWTLTSLKSRRSSASTGEGKLGIAECYGRALEIAEGRQYYQHYYVGRARGRLGKLGTNAFQRMVPQLRRYEFAIEAVVPAGQVAKYPIHWDMMGKRTYDSDIAIRMHCLKQVYR